MSRRTDALVELAFAAVEIHRTLLRLGLEGPAINKFSDAVSTFVRECLEPPKRETILLALDRAGAPRQPDMLYPADAPVEYEVERLADNVYRVRMDGRTFLCVFAPSDGWRISELAPK